HHAGGDCRYVPIFPELREHLLKVYEEAPEGSEYVITRYRCRNCNLRTQLLRIIKRAGVKPWPRMFHNLRSTRQTELTAEWPMQDVCAWLGNTQDVAMNHYLQITDDNFTRAAKAAHNAAQSVAASDRQHETEKSANDENAEECLSLAIAGESWQSVQRSREGSNL
ncbi:MAG: integrase, partial [Chthoniobacterales bacterium]|nr:integrase [Chthoniobacterales bacterium]